MKRIRVPSLLIAALMSSVSLGGEDGAPAEAKPARVLDVAPLEGYREGSRFMGHLSAAWFSPDGRRLVTTALRGGMRVWDGSTGKLVATFGAEQTEPLRNPFDAALLSKGRWVAACCPWMHMTVGGRGTTAGGLLRVWDVERREEIFRFASDDHIKSISVSSNEKYISCFTITSRLLVIDTTKDRKVSVKADLELAPAVLTVGHATGHDLGDKTDIAADGLRAVVIRSGTQANGLILYDVARDSTRSGAPAPSPWSRVGRSRS